MSVELYDETRQYFLDLIDHFYEHGGDFAASVEEAEQAAERAGFTKADMFEIMLSRWTDKVEDALSDGVLTEEEEAHLYGISDGLEFDALEVRDDNRTTLPQLIARAKQLNQQAGKLSRIRRIRDGKLKVESFDGVIPFKLQKDEVPVCREEGVTLREVVRESRVQGQSLGFSFRIAKGVYVRPSSFSAAPEHRESLKDVDKGTVILTTKHIVFDGEKKHFKLRLTSLANIQPYSDGLELQKNTQTARPFFLFPLDGWFFYNAIQSA